MVSVSFDEWESLYSVLSERLVGYGVVTREQCDTISRKGHRKQRYWKRHIVDLCEFVLESMQRNDVWHTDATATCNAGLKIVKEYHGS